MKVTPLEIPEVLLIEPRVFGDERGYFFESFQESRYAEAGISSRFVQDNVSRSTRGVLRGLHLQNPDAQGKLVQVLDGEVLDVAVDVRVGSPSFGRFASAVLSSKNHLQLWVPPGFAHGFFVTSGSALFAYKCTTSYRPEAELGIAWNDPDIAITWPAGEKKVSTRDASHPRLRELSNSKLPRYG